MSQLRLKIELNKGQDGISLGKFARVAEEIHKFLEMLSQDIKLVGGEWIADNFRNGSLICTENYIGRPDEAIVAVGQKALDHVTDPKTKAASLSYGITKPTFHQYAKIGLALPGNEFITFGVYNGSRQPKRRKLSRQRAITIEKQIVQTVHQYGGFQGRITALFKSSNKLWIEDLLTGRTVSSCTFKPEMYGHVIKALQSRDAIVSVEGWQKITNGEIEEFDIETITLAPSLSDDTLQKFFGCDPGFTGRLTTEDYLEQLRHDEIETQFIS